jgi:hypothetical protein
MKIKLDEKRKQHVLHVTRVGPKTTVSWKEKKVKILTNSNFIVVSHDDQCPASSAGGDSNNHGYL